MNCCIEGMDLHLVQNLLHWGERGKWRRRGGGGGKVQYFIYCVYYCQKYVLVLSFKQK
jgi:hypothetical protein